MTSCQKALTSAGRTALMMADEEVVSDIMKPSGVVGQCSGVLTQQKDPGEHVRIHSV